MVLSSEGPQRLRVIQMNPKEIPQLHVAETYMQMKPGSWVSESV